MQFKSTNLVWWTAASTVGAIGLSGVTVGQERQTDAGFDFKGRMLVSVSDADMVASTYIDGNLGPVDGRDARSVIRLDKPSRKLRAVEVGVSNSVTGPPDSIAVTPDGKYAIVIETRKQRPAGKLDPKLSDLAVGRTITVVDLSNPDRPRVVQRIESFRQPTSIAINPQGSLVAVSFDPRGDGKQTPLAFYRFRGGKLSAPLTPQIPGWTAGDALLNVEFHPQEPILSLVNLTKPNLSFVRFTDVGSAINLTRWGNAVGLESGPFMMHFTPNGRHAIVNVAYYTEEVQGPGGVTPPRGSVQSIRLAADSAADGTPIHRLVSRAGTGSVPEGLNVSPNGRWVVTTNLENSTFSVNDPRQGFFSSLTLLQLDPETGVLSPVDDFAFDSVLPEAVVFDNSSRYLAATDFDYFDPRRTGGTIDFWRITENRSDSRIELVKLDYSIPVTRGAHSMVITR